MFQVKCAHELYYRTRVTAMTFAGVGEAACKNGPAWSRPWASTIRYAKADKPLVIRAQRSHPVNEPPYQKRARFSSSSIYVKYSPFHPKRTL